MYLPDPKGKFPGSQAKVSEAPLSGHWIYDFLRQCSARSRR